jgi:hypothetical protein
MFIDLGKLQKSKEGRFYIKIDQDVNIHITGVNFRGEKIDRTLVKGDVITLEDEREERLPRLYKNKSPEELQKRIDETPEFVRYHVSVRPPADNQVPAKKEPVKKSFKRPSK